MACIRGIWVRLRDGTRILRITHVWCGVLRRLPIPRLLTRHSRHSSHSTVVLRPRVAVLLLLLLLLQLPRLPRLLCMLRAVRLDRLTLRRPLRQRARKSNLTRISSGNGPRILRGNRTRVRYWTRIGGSRCLVRSDNRAAVLPRERSRKISGHLFHGSLLPFFVLSLFVLVLILFLRLFGLGHLFNPRGPQYVALIGILLTFNGL